MKKWSYRMIVTGFILLIIQVLVYGFTLDADMVRGSVEWVLDILGGILVRIGAILFIIDLAWRLDAFLTAYEKRNEK